MATGIGSKVGKYVGNLILPGIGGLIGAVIGGAIGGVVDRAIFGDNGADPKNSQGPRISDLAVTSTTLGRTIPKLWGTMICGGNIIQSSQIVEHSNLDGLSIDKKDEKKGVTLPPETFTYTVTFAVGFCEGPAEAVLRIWSGNELIYDVTGTGVVSTVFEAIRIYLGTEDQLPDPALEALVGADDVLAYRGLVYVVFENIIATGQPPQITAEIAMASTPAAPKDSVDSDLKTVSSVLFGGILAAIESPTLRVIDAIGKTEILSVNLTAGQWANDQGIAEIGIGRIPIDASGYIYTKRAETVTASFWKFDPLTGELVGRTSLIDLGGGNYTGDFPIPAIAVIDGVVVGPPGSQRLVVVGSSNTGIGCRVGVYQIFANDVASQPAPGIDLLPQIAQNSFNDITGITLSVDDVCLAADADGNVWLIARGGGNGYLFTVDTVSALPVATHVLAGRGDIHGLAYLAAENALLFWDDTAERLLKWDIDDQAITAELDVPAVLIQSQASIARGVINNRLWLASGANTAYEIDVLGDMRLVRTVDSQASYSVATWWPIYDPLQNALVVYSFPTQGTVYWLYLDRETGGTATLQEIVEDIHAEVGHTAGDQVDATALSGVTVRGYALSNRAPAVGGIKALIPAFQFDGRESDWQVEYVLRGGAVAITIPAEDLAARADLNADVPEIIETRGQEIEMPERIDVTYPSVERDYETGDQHARRIREAVTTRSQITIDLPVKLSDTEAKNAAERLLDLTWIARDRYTIFLPMEYIRIDAADVIQPTLADGTTREIFVQQINAGTDGVIEVSGTRNDAAVFDFDYTGASGSGFVETAVRFAGPTALYVMDIPLFADSDDGLGMYVAGGAYGSQGWPGAAVFRSTDSNNWASYALLPSSQEATHGTATTALASPPRGAWTTWDRTNTVTVRLFRGTLSSATELAVLNGANTMLIGDEIIRFATATLNADGSYTLSTLLRGRRGTEWAIDDHTANEIAVVLSGPQHITMESDDLNDLAFYMAVTVGATAASSIQRSVTFTGASQKPYSPCHIEGSYAGSPADWTITWERRTRIGGAWNDMIDVPLGEETEDYEIDILSADGAGGDADWDDVVLLVDAATNANDLSDLEATATLGSQASVSGGQIVFSPSGSVDPSEAYVEYVDRADYTIGTQAFCIEVDATFDDLTATLQIIASHYTNTGNQRAWNIERNGNNLDFNYSSNGSSTSTLSGAFTFVTGSKYRLCVERDASNVLRIYVNGAVVASASGVTASIFNSTAPVRLGKYRSAGFTDLPLFGKVDNFRMTIGSSRYGGAYTPSSFPASDVGEVIRTITSDPVEGGSYIDPDTRTAVYTQVDQISDFGSPPSSIDIKAYQLSALVGRGFARAATLSL